MLSEQIQNSLSSDLNLCAYCILRFSHKDTFYERASEISDPDSEVVRKKTKPNICVACLDIFHQIDNVVNELVTKTNLLNYECFTIYSSVHIPIALLSRDLSIWIFLLNQFPAINNGNILFF